LLAQQKDGIVEESYEELMLPLFQRLGGNPDVGDARLEHIGGNPDATAVTQPLITEAANTLAAAHRAASRALEQEVLAHIYAQTPQFFEGVIIDLLLAMGYANRRRDLVQQLGRSHDGGVDGMVSQDPLGLDVILLQAKRLKPNSVISASQVRDFIGTLETKKATKGIFVTTGDFSSQARTSIQSISNRVRLINGKELSALMVRHNIGVSASQSFVFKELDRSYFSPLKTVKRAKT
jgi:restriction system protein